MPNTPILPPDEELLDRYLAGALQVDERLRLEAYCAKHPRYAQALDVLRATATRADMTPAPSASETLPGMLQRIDRDAPRALPRRPLGSRRLYRYGAFAGLFATVTLLVIGVFNRQAPQSTTIENANVYQTGVGQRTTIDLADGSRVVMGPQTTLTVPEPFATSSRTVALVGQAQFDVVGHRALPFIVNAGAVSTRVLGTRFVVQRYDDDSVATVQVMQGRVSTTARHQSALLTPGMVGTFTDSTTVTVESKRPAEVAAWVNGHLEFVDTPVPAMLASLTRWYGYEFQLTDSTLAKRHVTATFKVGDREETLRLLKGLLGVSMTVRGSTIILRPAPPERPTRAPQTMPEGKMASAVTAASAGPAVSEVTP